MYTYVQVTLAKWRFCCTKFAQFPTVFFANFCALFSHEAEQLLCNIPHCYATSLVQMLRNIICATCARIKIAQNLLRQKESCAIFFEPKTKLRKNLNPYTKTISLHFMSLDLHNHFKIFLAIFCID